VRTTLTLEDDVAARLQAEARRTGRPFKAVVNEHLRRSLAQRPRPKGTPRFSVQPHDLGGPLPGHAYDAIGSLLDQLEGPERR
jgi:hypothetical protein